MCIDEAREHLGRFLKRFVLKYKSTIIINDSSLSQSEDGKSYFYYGVFPVMLAGVCIVTGVDIYFYVKYRYTSSYNDKKFLYLFPIPCVAPCFFVVNSAMSLATTARLFCRDKNNCSKESVGDISQILSKQDPSEMECKNKAKQICERVLTTFTLFLLFGVVYLFYHGFWIIIALLIYPGRILIGGMFIIPLILATIPTWITVSKMVEKLFDSCNKSPRILPENRQKDESCNNALLQGCAWLALFFYEVVFWGLFIVILFYTSRFLLASIDTKNEMVKLVLSYIIISVASLILAWLNTDLVINLKDKKENPGGQ